MKNKNKMQNLKKKLMYNKNNFNKYNNIYKYYFYKNKNKLNILYKLNKFNIN